ncbi:MAG: right-handed parallel beta-helix repeat-containing protein [Candidatus Thorarchaeota archaeon]|jgi:parallel beta-helix repeat protein
MRSHTLLKLIIVLGFSFLLLGSMSVVLNSVNFSESALVPVEEFQTAYIVHDAIWITGNEEFVEQAATESWPGNGSASSPYIITGYSTDLYWVFTGNLVDGDGQDVECGTWIEDVENAVISDNTFVNRDSGMVLMGVANVNVTNNLIHDCRANGIEVLGMMADCLISGNTIYSFYGSGIRLANGATNLTIIDNTIDDITQMGINIMGGCYDSVLSGNTMTDTGLSGIMVAMSFNSVISFNSVTNSSDSGIEIMGANSLEVYNNSISNIDENGLDLTYCDYSSIFNNTVIDCSGIGLYAQSGENTTIQWNRIEDVDGFAVHLDVDVEYFDVMYNTFIENGIDCQVCDDSIDSVILCNYYSDWNTPDIDSNGFVDVVYDINGDAENEDALPLAVPGVIPPTVPPTTSPPPTESLAGETLVLVGVAVVVLVLGIVLIIKRRTG